MSHVFPRHSHISAPIAVSGEGCYLIDSNGKVYNPEIVESVPEGVWDDQGLKAVKQMEYEPSQSNTNKIPVYVTTEFHFGNRV